MLTKVGFPAARCVTLDQAKAHMRVDHDLEDDNIALYLDAAIADCADYSGRAFDQQQFRFVQSCWPACGYIDIPIAPVVAVASLSYLDEDGETQTVALDHWYWKKTDAGARIFLRSTFDLPTLTEDRGRDSVIVELEAGYDPPDYSEADDPELALPAQAKAAILLTAGHLFANRESTVIGKGAVELPRGAKRLLDQIRIYR